VSAACRVESWVPCVMDSCLEDTHADSRPRCFGNKDCVCYIYIRTAAVTLRDLFCAFPCVSMTEQLVCGSIHDRSSEQLLPTRHTVVAALWSVCHSCAYVSATKLHCGPLRVTPTAVLTWLLLMQG
jgi:hypothetical protein